MRIHMNFKRIGGAAALTLLLACGGGGSDSGGTPASNGASKIAYTDPTPSPTQWALMKDPASTDKHLILNLVPPSDAVSGFGVGLTINAPTSLVWSKVTSSDAQFIHNTAYALGGGTQLIKAVSANGNLIAGVYQKGIATAAVTHSVGAVASIAVDLKSGAAKAASATLTVSASQELQASGMQPINIAVGSIALQ